MVRFSLTPISFSRLFGSGEMGLEQYIRCGAELGLDGVDLLDSRSYPWLWGNRREQLKKVSAEIKSCGVAVAAYACGNNFATSAPQMLDREVDRVANAITEASEVGAPLLRIFGGYYGHDKSLSRSQAYERVLEGIERCLPHAEKHGIVLAVENHGVLPGHSYELEAIVGWFQNEHVKVTFDCANFLANNMDEKEDPIQAWHRVGNAVKHVHVKDVRPAGYQRERQFEGCVCGQGVVPLRQFMAEVARSQFDGYCSLEFEGGHAIGEREGVRLSIQYLHDLRRVHDVFTNRDASWRTAAEELSTQ